MLGIKLKHWPWHCFAKELSMVAITILPALCHNAHVLKPELCGFVRCRVSAALSAVHCC
jgi:hypothetical protein